MTPEQRQIRELRRNLKDLVESVGVCLGALDAEMRTPSDAKRGQRVAAICNALDLAHDRAAHFGLDMSFEAIARAKRTGGTR